MRRVALVSGVICLVVAIIVFAFAHGLRRWYSGIFFVFMAAVMFLNAWRWRRPVEE